MIEFENGTLKEEGFVEINGVKHKVNMPEYTGGTPLTAENLNKLQRDVMVPIGGIIGWPSDNIPENWLLADGTLVSRTQYKELFNIIGTTFGEGDGANTFALHNICGRTIIGKNDTDNDFNQLGKIGGEKAHRLTEDEMPEHKHNYNLSYGKVATASNTNGKIAAGDQGNAWQYGNDTHTSITNTGGNKEHNNLSPFLVLNYIIKVK